MRAVAGRVLFQVTVQGDVVDSAPIGLPSSMNRTPITAMSSAAVALTCTDAPETVPPVGDAIDTVGAVVSPAS